jgi:hypothetical protein
MHEPDPSTPLDETLEALHELVREGTVRHIGSSNYSAEQIEQADALARDRGWTRFVSAQNHYSLVERDVEQDVLPACERLGIGQLPYFPLASGLLTGKYRRGQEATEGRLAGREIPEERWDRAEQVQRYADERGVLDQRRGVAVPAGSEVQRRGVHFRQHRERDGLVRAGRIARADQLPDEQAALLSLEVDRRRGVDVDEYAVLIVRRPSGAGPDLIGARADRGR